MYLFGGKFGFLKRMSTANEVCSAEASPVTQMVPPECLFRKGKESLKEICGTEMDSLTALSH